MSKCCGTNDENVANKSNTSHFEAHYKVRILPKESCLACNASKVMQEPKATPSNMPPSTSMTTCPHLEVSRSAPNDEVKQLIQNYIAETRKLIYEFARFEDGFKDGCYPRTLPEESIDQLANVHQNASKTLLDIRKTYQKRSASPANYNHMITRKDHLGKITKPRTASATRKADHSIVAFTIKAAKPQTSMITELRPPQENLNKGLSMRASTACTQCGSTKTPEWRSGPSGSRTLCNACGLFYSKLVKKMGVEGACDSLKKRKRTVSET